MTQQKKMTVEADLEAIKQIREAHIAAVNRGDVDAWMALYAEDAVQMPPNMSANIGRRKIRPWANDFLAPYRSAAYALLVDEIHVAGDWAFERGAYKITLTNKEGGGSIQDIGKYITIYQRQPDGQWAMARDIWNSNSLPPSMG